tara:strand:+ start:356 stop:859 length:504 start_codon:yes stop_codon:yes gene_type:complete
MTIKIYSLSKNQIIAFYQESIRAICASVLYRNQDIHLLNDLVQDVNVILLSQMKETIQSLHETNQFNYFVARVVTNQVLSNSSPFHNTYRLRTPKNTPIEGDYEPFPDKLWKEVDNLNSPKARDILYLRFEYGLKIKEIAIIKGCSVRYIHKVLVKSYKIIKNNSKN